MMQNILYRLLGKLLPFAFPFLTSVTLFSHFFNQKLLICIHLRLFMHTIQNNTFLSSRVSPIEIQVSSALKYKALYVDGTPDH